jgi:ATP-dependent DNA helicase RecQ
VPAPSIDDARATLRARFGFPDFRPGQERAVASVLAARDTLVVLPTGGGKSLCYQVPALLLPGLTVVVSPLISLMKDQVDALIGRGLPATFINSTLSGGQVSERLAAVHRGDVKLLYLAPERFDAGTMAGRLRSTGVSLLAIDEAHCISEWGHDFRPSYLRVKAVREQLGAPPTIALTATATPHVRRDIATQLALRDPAVIITGFNRPNLRYFVRPSGTEQAKDDAMIAALKAADGVAVVYASTRRAVERISSVLERGRVRAAAYHAGLDDEHRHEVQDAFMQERVRAIVATNAFGMGIDKPNVRLVLHHSMPGTLEAYYQEAGRAGRDGLQSDCILLHAFPDRFTHEFFIKGSHPERSLVERVYGVLRAAAGETGSVQQTADEIANRIGGKVTGREVESALRILARASAVATVPESGDRVFVRLLATPDRITRELGAADSQELGLLRALWRASRGSVAAGALIDLDGLPPGVGGHSNASPLLASLQARQFLMWERTGGGLRLNDRTAAISAFDIDWALLDRRRRSELAKLDAMQKYAYTDGCRRAFVLRYFGDESAGADCGGCDNCLGIRSPTAAKGGRRSRVKSRERYASSGAGDDRKSPGRGARRADGQLEEADKELFNALKTLRGTLAREEKVPPYVIFPDRTLAELATRRPRSLVGFGDVFGVGPARLAKFGERFLAVIRDANDSDAA